MEEVEKDAVFYESSGGGVTFSGGEPRLWPDVLKVVGARVKALGFHTAVETCGCFPIENFEHIREAVDLALFDIKLMDEEKHKRYCGASNRQILSNFKTVVESIPVIVRIPIIPGINDSPEEQNQIRKFLLPYRDLVQEIHLLPYHNLGASKYDALCQPYLLNHLKAPSKEQLEKLKERFAEAGFFVRIGG